MGPIYVAFDGDEDKWAYAFMKGWSTNHRVDFDFRDAHELDNMTGRAQNEAYVKSMLKERMRQSAALLVIVGEKTKNLYKYVRWEIELAFELGLPIVVANLNGQNTMDPERCPPLLRTACAVHIPFKKDAIKHALAIWPVNGGGSMRRRKRRGSVSLTGSGTRVCERHPDQSVSIPRGTIRPQPRRTVRHGSAAIYRMGGQIPARQSGRLACRWSCHLHRSLSQWSVQQADDRRAA